ncbi:MAG: alpha/beta hydrolase [Geminicoccaceae bacterium]|nr:MAG: alpha/beta hydrolase [Geminicoccaceae bacterium]
MSDDRTASPQAADPPRTEQVVVDGLTFHVRIAGQGQPLVLLHGFPDDGDVWRHQVAPLAALGRTVIVPDLRGCGATDAPVATSRYRLDRLAQDVLDLVDQLVPGGSAFDLAGHDWGAALGWHLAASHPHRVRRFAALSVGHPEAYRRAGAAQKRKGWYLLLFATPWLAEAVLRANGFRALTRNAPTSEDAERWRRNLGRPGRLSAGLAWYRANLTPTALAQHLPPVTVPTLGLYSDQDIALAEDQMTGSAAYVEAPWRYVRLEGVGHWLQIEAAAAINRELIDWFGVMP